MQKLPVSRNNIIRGAAVTVIVLLVLAVVFCPRVSNAGATIAAALLLYVTLEYVLANHENVQLFGEQIKHQRGVFLDFGVISWNAEPVLWVANLGIATFLIKDVMVRTKDKEFPSQTQLLVPAGKIEHFVIPDDVWKSASIVLDIQVSLQYSGIEELGTTKPKVFSLAISLDNRVHKVREGLGWPWTVQCPKCSQWVANMRVDVVNSFDEVEQRLKVTEKDFSESCPAHRSHWIWIRTAE